MHDHGTPMTVGGGRAALSLRAQASRVVASAAVLLCGVAASVAAQGEQPLRKTDLVSLLTHATFTKGEIAAQVRRNCLTFRPSPRDRADLTALGADAQIFDAIASCAVRETATRVLASRTRVVVEAGAETMITVRIVRGTAPQPGVALVLQGSGAPPGGAVADLRAVSNARGSASFTMSAGTAAAVYRLRAVPVSGAARGVGIELRVVAARPAAARVRPARVEFGLAAGDERRPVSVALEDRFGNPVGGQDVELRLSGRGAGSPLVGTTSAAGQVGFELARSSFPRAGEVGVYVRGERLASVPVSVGPPPLSETLTRFVAGADQRGVAGARLAQPLIFEVRDTAGAPVPGLAVSFAATGGAGVVGAGPTDSSGAVRVRVTLGQRAGPAVVTANVRAMERSVTVYAEPGPAQELAVWRDSAAVTGPLALQSRRPVVLRVVARDSYGNETALTDFTAVATGPAVRVNEATAQGSEGMVTLEPRRRGVGEVKVSGSGLEASVAVEVTLPAAVAEGWLVGARGSWAGFSYAYKPVPYVQGRPGARGELFAGRALSPHLRLELAAGLGSLKADSSSREASVALTQGYVRGEYALVTEGAVIPLVALGAGGFRIKSDDPRHFVYHTSFFWLAGVGFDARLGGSAIAEVRLDTQQLNEMSSKYVNGHVGALTVVQAGVRLSL